MKWALQWGGLGFFLGLFISYKFQPKEPLSPSLWADSALIAAYRKLELEARMVDSRPSYPNAPSTRAAGVSRVDAQRRLASTLGQPLSLLGEFHFRLHRRDLHAGRQAMRVNCAQSGECCSQFLHWDEEKETWRTEFASGGLNRGYFDESSHFVMELRSFFPPQFGLPFVGAYVEIPLAGQEETHVLGMDPDSGRWEPHGKLRWKQMPPLEACI